MLLLPSPRRLNRETSNPSSLMSSGSTGREERLSRTRTSAFALPLSINPRATLLLDPLGSLASHQPSAQTRSTEASVPSCVPSESGEPTTARRAESASVVGGVVGPWGWPVKEFECPSVQPSLLLTQNPDSKLPESPVCRLLTPSLLHTASVTMSAVATPFIPYLSSDSHIITTPQ